MPKRRMAELGLSLGGAGRRNGNSEKDATLAKSRGGSSRTLAAPPPPPPSPAPLPMHPDLAGREFQIQRGATTIRIYSFCGD
uniref:Uncharacterized protein n=1 Tax=Oryza brachyantha TaxID=4533 RepID=J3LLF1_ORYBR